MQKRSHGRCFLFGARRTLSDARTMPRVSMMVTDRLWRGSNTYDTFYRYTTPTKLQATASCICKLTVLCQ